MAARPASCCASSWRSAGGTCPCCGAMPRAKRNFTYRDLRGLFGLGEWTVAPTLVAELPLPARRQHRSQPHQGSAAMKFDSIAIGGGMAGLSAALRLAEAGQEDHP